MATPLGDLPRLRGIEAVRGYCLSLVPLSAVELLLDGTRIRVEPVTAAPTIGRGLRKYVFNIWHDFGSVPSGLHSLTVRPSGWSGRIRSCERRIMIEELPAADATTQSDAYIPHAADDARSPEMIVEMLPSAVRSTRRSVLPACVRSILAVRADQLGDLIVSMPALLRLRALFPDARLVGLVTPANLDAARAFGVFDAVEVADYTDPTGSGVRTMSAEAEERIRAALAVDDFDIAVDLGEGAQSRLLLLLSGARFLYGFAHGEHSWLSASFQFNARDTDNGIEVMAPSRKLLALVEALGALRPTAPLTLPGDASGLADLSSCGIAPGERFIVLHTGARLVPSRWPGYAELAALLLRRTPHTLVVLSPGEPWAPARCLPGDAARIRVIEHALPFSQFDTLLGRCAVFIGNDSGPKHLAALRGTRTVSLHMARLNWSEWGQEGDGLIVSRRVPCAGCNIGEQPDECGRDYACIRQISPEEVCEAVLSLL